MSGDDPEPIDGPARFRGTLLLPADLRRPAPRTLDDASARETASRLLEDSYGAARDDIEALARWALERAMDQDHLARERRDAEMVRRQAEIDVEIAREAHAATHAVLRATRTAVRRQEYEFVALRAMHAEVTAERDTLRRQADECLCGAAVAASLEAL
jgi:hypothetical protein